MTTHFGTSTATESSPADDGAWGLLRAMLPVADWTAEALARRFGVAVDLAATGRRDVFDELARGLFRTGRRHLLVTGDKGVGKTAVVRELARRAAVGEIPFLADKRFLWIDAANVGPEDSRACLETLAAAVGGRGMLWFVWTGWMRC